MTLIARVTLIAALLFTLVMALKPLTATYTGQELDKLQHIVAFFTLAVLTRLAFPRAALAVLFAALAAFGALIEVAQMIPGLNRFGDVDDWLADLAAAAAGLLLISLFQRLLARE